VDVQTVRWLALAEECGFDLLTSGDSQSLWPECFTASTLSHRWSHRPGASSPRNSLLSPTCW
jgi:hypothetical protein